MIVVTGAGGTVGSEVLRQLREAKAAVRAAFHSSDKAEAARRDGVDAVTVDMRDPSSLEKAFTGCEKLFLLGPVAPDQAQLEKNAVTAAKTSGIKHIVKLSVMNAEKEDFLFGKLHRDAERSIEGSGLEWTFIRANSFMQNTVNYMGDSIRTQSAFYSATDNAPVWAVDVRDIAAVAVKALTEPGHEGKAYALNGDEGLTYDEMAAEISKAVGRDVSHVRITLEDMRSAMQQQGVPEWFAEQLIDLDRYYRDGKAKAVGNDIRAVTGRDARKFADFVKETAATGVWDAQAANQAG